MTARIIRAVLFDLGGTLMFSREPWEPILERGYRAMAESFFEQGLGIDPHDLPRAIRYHLDQYFARRDQDFYETTYTTVLRELLHEKGHPDVETKVIRRALDAFYGHTQANWTLEEDALLALRTLEAGGYRLGLVSNAGDNQDVFQLVDRFKIEPFFDFVLTSAACSYRKPHPRIFELALAHWHVPAQEVVMVGDSLSADIAGAQALGLYTAWISRRASRTAARSTVRPEAELKSLSELPVLLSCFRRDRIAAMNPPSNKKLIAYLCLLAGIFALGMTAMFVRWANAPGPITAFYRLAIAAAMTAPFFLLQMRRGPAVPLAHFIFPVLGGLMTAGDFALWYTSVQYTSAANATLLGNTAPLWVAIAAVWFLGEKRTTGFWLALALTLSGAAIIVSRDFLLHPTLGLGDALALTAALFYAGYMLITQRGRTKLDAFRYWWVNSLSAGLGLLVINLLIRNPFSGYSTQSWQVFFASAIISQLIGYLSISYALGHLPASVVSPTMIGQPIVTTILAIPLLGESPNGWQILGGALALTGIYILNQSHLQAEKKISFNRPIS